MSEKVENITEVRTETKPTQDRPQRRDNRAGGRRPNNRRRNDRKEDNFEEVVITINRVVKVVKGGRTFRFAAVVVAGDRRGQVGYGTGKSKEVPDAIKKAAADARANMIRVKMVGSTLPHDIIGKHDSGSILMKPAPEGTGIIAGGPVRKVLELAGYKDVVSKSLGSNTPINMIRATFDGLNRLETKESIAALRDIDIKKLG